MWGLSPSDDNAQINAYKATYGITNPCAGTEGGGPNAINVTTAGQNFLGYPTYCIVCPDRTLYFDVCWPPTESCFDPYIENCQPALAAGFSADPGTGCQGQPVQYMDESTGSPTSWNWTFEGGDPSSSTDQNPLVTYLDLGTFEVSLEVSDGTDTSTYAEPDFMSVFEIPEVTLEPLDTACLNWTPYELTGGMPEGGVYSGPGVMDNMFDPSAAGLGTHTITYTYEEDGCENHAESEIVVDICAGINEFSAENLRIYPNPSKGNFTLYLNHEGQVKIMVYNLLGETIYQEEVSAAGQYKMQINLQGIPEGLYLVAVQAGEEKYLQKLKILSR